TISIGSPQQIFRVFRQHVGDGSLYVHIGRSAHEDVASQFVDASSERVNRAAEKIDDSNRLFPANPLQVDDHRTVALQIVGDFLSLLVGTRLGQNDADLFLGVEGNHFVSPP